MCSPLLFGQTQKLCYNGPGKHEHLPPGNAGLGLELSAGRAQGDAVRLHWLKEAGAVLALLLLTAVGTVLVY